MNQQKKQTALLFLILVYWLLASSLSRPENQSMQTHLQVESEGKQGAVARGLQYLVTYNGTVAYSSNSPASASLSQGSSKHRKRQPPSTTWALIFPAISVSVLSLFLRKHGIQCCGDATAVQDDSVPAEIVVRYMEDIELQSVHPIPAVSHRQKDPVQGLSMLDTSDWTDENKMADSSQDQPDTAYTIFEG